MRMPGNKVFLMPGRKTLGEFALLSNPAYERPILEEKIPNFTIRDFVQNYYSFISGDLLGTFRYLETYGEIRPILSECDVIHLNSFDSNSLMYLLRYFAKKPFLVTIHNLPNPSHQFLPASKGFQWNERRILKQLRTKTLP
jgi:hypothetical protein